MGDKIPRYESRGLPFYFQMCWYILASYLVVTRVESIEHTVIDNGCMYLFYPNNSCSTEPYLDVIILDVMFALFIRAPSAFVMDTNSLSRSNCHRYQPHHYGLWEQGYGSLSLPQANIPLHIAVKRYVPGNRLME